VQHNVHSADDEVVVLLARIISLDNQGGKDTNHGVVALYQP